MSCSREEFHIDDRLIVVKHYLDGKLDGQCKYWYENGHIQKKLFYCGGMKEGKFVNYYDDGRILSNGNYQRDKRSGECRMMNRNWAYECHFYYFHNSVLDFSLKKKFIFLNLKNRLRQMVFFPYSEMLIPDLRKFVILF